MPAWRNRRASSRARFSSARALSALSSATSRSRRALACASKSSFCRRSSWSAATRSASALRTSASALPRSGDWMPARRAPLIQRWPGCPRMLVTRPVGALEEPRLHAFDQLLSALPGGEGLAHVLRHQRPHLSALQHLRAQIRLGFADLALLLVKNRQGKLRREGERGRLNGVLPTPFLRIGSGETDVGEALPPRHRQPLVAALHFSFERPHVRSF